MFTVESEQRANTVDEAVHVSPCIGKVKDIVSGLAPMASPTPTTAVFDVPRVIVLARTSLAQATVTSKVGRAWGRSGQSPALKILLTRRDRERCRRRYSNIAAGLQEKHKQAIFAKNKGWSSGSSFSSGVEERKPRDQEEETKKLRAQVELLRKQQKWRRAQRRRKGRREEEVVLKKTARC